MLRHYNEELCRDYPNLADQIPPPPELGTLNLEEVKNSVYFFS